MIINNLSLSFLLFLSIVFFIILQVHSITTVRSYTFTSTETYKHTPLQFTLSFTLNRDLPPNEYLVFTFPCLTRTPSISLALNHSSLSPDAPRVVTPSLHEIVQSTQESVLTQTDSSFDLLISNSDSLEAAWVEGENFRATRNIIEYLPPSLVLRKRTGLDTDNDGVISSAENAASMSRNTQISLQIFKENGISAGCSYPSSSVNGSRYNAMTELAPLSVYTYVSTHVDYASPETTIPNPIPIDQLLEVTDSLNYEASRSYSYTGFGGGCVELGWCNGHGKCDYMREACSCDEFYGSDTEKLNSFTPFSPNCTTLACPFAPAIGTVPTDSTEAHQMFECGAHGSCNRTTGVCNCYPPFTGPACNKLKCPNDCSGRGQCLSMLELSLVTVMDGEEEFLYGDDKNKAWDYNTMHGCLCDSSWEVGYKSGQYQLPEYFGPDCSLKRCPSGDNPYTSIDEEDCYGISQIPGSENVGEEGNKCHIDCSGRGICDHSTGTCKCFKGSWGEACNYMSNTGGEYHN